MAKNEHDVAAANAAIAQATEEAMADPMAGCRLILQRVAAHDLAYPFLRPVPEDVPNYYEVRTLK